MTHFSRVTLGYARRAPEYAYMCAHTLFLLSLSHQTPSADTIHFIHTSNLSPLQFFVLSWTVVKQCEHSASASLLGPGLLESGSIAAPVKLQGCRRHRNRKSIKAPMNQHSWPAPPGQCATLLAAPPLHCLPLLLSIQCLALNRKVQ